jgi:hypothetical protein
MAEEEWAEEEEQEHEEQGVYLLDLAASIFAIMLIYLLIVAYQASNAHQEADVAQYVAKDPETFNYPLQTWRPLNIHRNHWVLQNGTIWLLNIAGIAKLFNEKGTGLIYSSPEKGKIYVEIPPNGKYKTEFSLRFERSDSPKSGPDDKVFDQSFLFHSAVNDRGEPDANITSRFEEPFTIHVVGDPGESIYRDLQAIQKSKESCVVYFHESGGFAIERLQIDFALNKIYR